MISICVEMGWDYYRYMAQPTWFIESIKLHYKERAKQIKKLQQKQASGRR